MASQTLTLKTSYYMTEQEKDNILKKAHQIVFERAEEKERQYGNFEDGMQRAAQLATNMKGDTFTTEDIYVALIALKLSRHSYHYKEDNLLDAVAYIGSLDNFLKKSYNHNS